MAKYSFEIKMEMVKAYLNNEGSYTSIAKNMEFQIRNLFNAG